MADGSTVNIGGVTFTIRADSSKVNRELVRTEQRARQTGGVMVREFDRADRSVERLERSLKRGVSALALFGTGFAGAAIVGGLIEAADAMQLLRGRIQNVITEGETLDRVMRDLYTSANNNRISLDAQARLYLRLRNAIKDVNHESALALTNTFAKSLILSGASAQEATSSMLQFAQAMGSGRLAGDELRSLLENNARFARALADSLGVNVGQLKALGEAGVLTSDLVANAMTSQAASIETEFQNVPLTIDQAMQQLQNGLLMYVSQIDQSFGVSQRVASGIQLLTENIEELGDALIILGSAIAAGAGVYGLKLLGDQAAKFATAIGIAMATFGRGTPSGKLAARLDELRARYDAAGVAAGLARERINGFHSQLVTAQRAGASTPQLERIRSQMDAAIKQEGQFLRTQRVLQTEIGKTAAKLAESSRGVMGAMRNIGSVAAQVGTSIVNFFGGPVGIAIIGASLAMAAMTARTLEAERAARSIKSGLEIVADLNLRIAEGAEEGAEQTSKLAKAQEAQAKAMEAVNAARRKGLILELQQAKIDAQAELKRKAYLADFAGQFENTPGIRTPDQEAVFQSMLAGTRARVAELEEAVTLFDEGINALQSGLVEVGAPSTPQDSGLEKAKRVFQEVVDMQRAATTDPAFKSTIIKNALGALAEAPDGGLAAARAALPGVRELLTDQDAVAVEKNFRTIARASVSLKGALQEFSTPAEEFKKAIDDIRKADPSEGNKSRAAVRALIAYGDELKDIPAAMAAIPSLSDILKPEDAELARVELGKLATEAGKAFGADASVAAREYAESIRAIDEAEKALQATGTAYSAGDFAEQRAKALKEFTEATKETAPWLQTLLDLINETMTPTEKLAEELGELQSLRLAIGSDSAGNEAIDRRRVQLLVDEARAAGFAADALAKLKLLQAGTGYSAAQVRGIRSDIISAAAEGRQGMRFDEMSPDQQIESARQTFASSFAEALTEGVRSGDFGEAIRDVIANRAADALTDAFMQVGEWVGDFLFGQDGVLTGTLQGMLGGGVDAVADLGAAMGQAVMDTQSFSAVLGGAAVASATSAAGADATAAGAALTAAGALSLLATAASSAAVALGASSASSAAGGIGTIISGVGSLFGTGLPGNAHGGRGYAGEPMIVGESGRRELFIPGADGYVVPNSALEGAGKVRQGAKMPRIGIRMGDTIVQGDASENTLRLIQRENARQAQQFPRIVRSVLSETRRRS